ncbi:MAG: ketoacyl-ACP synthase III [Actinobacteria bacterium]|nr:ketoacyl-ACP synthase III [Actinomycetota bacterium]
MGTAPNGFRASITGIGSYVPDRVLTNAELSTMVDTSDEWIIERTGIRERRIAAPEQALSDLCRPAIEQALAQAGVEPASIDLLIVATVTPDMSFPSTGAILADELGMPDAGAYDLSAGCTGFMYALVQAYGMMAAGLSQRALVAGGDVLSKIMDWTDRTTCVLFGDGAGAVVLDRVDRGGFLGFELGADGSGGPQLYMPAGGSRMPATAETVAERKHFAQMNGREVFKFATRVLVSSALAILEKCGRSIDDVDVYIPHQANVRIIDHAVGKLGISTDKVVVNVDRFGNTSSGSIPLALAEADASGRLREGDIVLMTGMGAGLTWGSALMEWSSK